jgi:HEAT repeat protein
MEFPALFEEIADPWKYTVPEAVGLARRLLEVEPSLDIKLALEIPRLRTEWAERALLILDEISEGRRIVPFVSHLASHRDVRISSKIALVVGKRTHELEWAKRQLEEVVDPRVRANVIEGLWGISTAEARQLFRDRLTDRHHRVVGNSLIGLHLASDIDMKDAVLKAAENSNPAFRTMAAWVMGRIGDETYKQRLSQLLRDDDPAVRSAALRSLRKIRQGQDSQ